MVWHMAQTFLQGARIGTPLLEVDGRADIYSLGVCIFAMVAGFFPLEVARRADWWFVKLEEACRRVAAAQPVRSHLQLLQ